MEGLPDFTIPAILSFLGVRDACRCACIAKSWASPAQLKLVKMKEESAKARAQVQHYDI